MAAISTRIRASIDGREAAVEELPPGDWFDRTADYFNPGDGPWDFFRFCENTTAYAPYLSLSEQTQNILSGVRAGADLFGSALSIPKFFKNISTLRKNIVEWKSAQLPEGLFGKIASAFKNSKVRYEFFNTINTASQAALCLSNAKIFDLKTRFPLVNGINQITTILTDGQSLYDDYTHRNEGDKHVKMLKIAKYASSVAIASLVLLGIFYAAILQELAFVVLFLCSVYVVSSILSEVISSESRPILVNIHRI
ncbi:MAG TPA: hypothetical protein VLG76_00145 [Rhabdochlamydiaceae bacterium]|nr:hypothetical protein [Rhabdochlamydiaceae bacterium]